MSEPRHPDFSAPPVDPDEPTTERPRITVSKQGVMQVSPKEILESEVGREAIRKTAALGVSEQDDAGAPGMSLEEFDNHVDEPTVKARVVATARRAEVEDMEWDDAGAEQEEPRLEEEPEVEEEGDAPRTAREWRSMYRESEGRRRRGESVVRRLRAENDRLQKQIADIEQRFGGDDYDVRNLRQDVADARAENELLRRLLDRSEENGAALGSANSLLRRRLEEHENDVRLATSDLMVPIPEPGTDMARLLIANRIMRRRRAEVEEALQRYGQHDRNCISVQQAWRCSCGLDKLLEEQDA